MGLLIVILAAVAIILKVLVLKSLWAWFIVPFFGIAPLTFAMAFGFSLFATIAFGRLSTETQTEEESVAALVQSLILIVFIWFLGAVARGFI